MMVCSKRAFILREILRHRLWLGKDKICLESRPTLTWKNMMVDLKEGKTWCIKTSPESTCMLDLLWFPARVELSRWKTWLDLKEDSIQEQITTKWKNCLSLRLHLWRLICFSLRIPKYRLRLTTCSKVQADVLWWYTDIYSSTACFLSGPGKYLEAELRPSPFQHTS